MEYCFFVQQCPPSGSCHSSIHLTGTSLVSRSSNLERMSNERGTQPFRPVLSKSFPRPGRIQGPFFLLLSPFPSQGALPRRFSVYSAVQIRQNVNAITCIGSQQTARPIVASSGPEKTLRYRGTVVLLENGPPRSRILPLKWSPAQNFCSMRCPSTSTSQISSEFP